MDTATLLNIILAVVAVVSCVVAYLGWSESHSDRSSSKRQSQIEASMHPMDTRVSALELNFKNVESTIEAAIIRSQAPFLERFTSLETKMEWVWDQQKQLARQLAMDAARILHQPDPRRSMIDSLLEAFMDGTLSSEEERELRKYLIIIRNWEPGQDVGFPVHPGEQTAAAILLRTMYHDRSNE